MEDSRDLALLSAIKWLQLQQYAGEDSQLQQCKNNKLWFSLQGMKKKSSASHTVPDIGRQGEQLSNTRCFRSCKKERKGVEESADSAADCNANSAHLTAADVHLRSCPKATTPTLLPFLPPELCSSLYCSWKNVDVELPNVNAPRSWARARGRGGGGMGLFKHSEMHFTGKFFTNGCQSQQTVSPVLLTGSKKSHFITI